MAEYFSIVCVYHSLLSVHLVMDLGCAHILAIVNNCVCVCVCVQLCPTLCDPMDCSPSGSSVHGIFQARILEWVAVSFPGDLPT